MRGHDRINTCLPDELIFEVFRRLDSKPSRDACSLVCKRWLALERLSRTTLRIGATGSPDLVVDLLARLFRNVRSVHIDERLNISLPTHPVITQPIRSIPNSGRRRGTDIAAVSSVRLHSANGSGVLDSNSLSDAGMTAIGDGFPKLEKLSLIWCSNVSSIGLISLADKCKMLKSLDLQGCYVGDQGLAAVGQCCKQLEDLNLRFCEGLTDVCVVELALGVGNSLKSLGITACAKITDTAMEAVGLHCKSLENLSLDAECIHNKGVVSVAQGCPALKSLKLQCINVTDEALTAVGTSCSSLEVLALYSFQAGWHDSELRDYLVQHGLVKSDYAAQRDDMIKLIGDKYQASTSAPYLAWPDARLRAYLRDHGVDDTKYATRPSLVHEVRIRYVQAGSRVESILAKIREAIGGGVDYAEDKLSSVLEILTGSKLSLEQQLEKNYAAASASASSLVSVASASASSLGANAVNQAASASHSAINSASSASASASSAAASVSSSLSVEASKASVIASKSGSPSASSAASVASKSASSAAAYMSSSAYSVASEASKSASVYAASASKSASSVSSSLSVSAVSASKEAAKSASSVSASLSSAYHRASLSAASVSSVASASASSVSSVASVSASSASKSASSYSASLAKESARASQSVKAEL